jgi:hypothetical protein
MTREEVQQQRDAEEAVLESLSESQPEHQVNFILLK